MNAAITASGGSAELRAARCRSLGSFFGPRADSGPKIRNSKRPSRHECSFPRTRFEDVGTSTFAAAAFVAAAQLGYAVQGVVSRSGRPDFAGDTLARVVAPTLLIVGERDEPLLGITQRAFARLAGRKHLSVVAGAGHLFEEPGTLEQVGALAADWFHLHLKPIRRT